MMMAGEKCSFVYADYSYAPKQESLRFFIKDFEQLAFIGYDEELLMMVVYQQPIVVTVDAGSFCFDKYRGGVYKVEPYFFKQELHYMLLVGYGRHMNQDVWILQNSHGTKFGDKGFMYMKLNTGTTLGCSGIRVSPLFPIIDEVCKEVS
jgi:hypothetical protein